MATITMTAPSKQESKPGKPRGLWILLILVVGVLAALAWWALHRKAAAEANSNQYKWILPEIRNITTDVNATGTVKLKTGAVVRVGAQLSGIVRRLNVTVGSDVKQGDVIAEIDSRPVTARIDQARAQLAQAFAASQSWTMIQVLVDRQSAKTVDREQDISLPSPRLTSVVSKSVSLARMIPDRVGR